MLIASQDHINYYTQVLLTPSMSLSKLPLKIKHVPYLTSVPSSMVFYMSFTKDPVKTS